MIRQSFRVPSRSAIPYKLVTQTSTALATPARDRFTWAVSNGWGQEVRLAGAVRLTGEGELVEDAGFGHTGVACGFTDACYTGSKGTRSEGLR